MRGNRYSSPVSCFLDLPGLHLPIGNGLPSLLGAHHPPHLGTYTIKPVHIKAPIYKRHASSEEHVRRDPSLRWHCSAMLRGGWKRHAFKFCSAARWSSSRRCRSQLDISPSRTSCLRSWRSGGQWPGPKRNSSCGSFGDAATVGGYLLKVSGPLEQYCAASVSNARKRCAPPTGVRRRRWVDRCRTS